jgi:hypothetical protein
LGAVFIALLSATMASGKEEKNPKNLRQPVITATFPVYSLVEVNDNE